MFGFNLRKLRYSEKKIMSRLAEGGEGKERYELACQYLDQFSFILNVKIPHHLMSLPDSGHDAGFEVIYFCAISWR